MKPLATPLLMASMIGFSIDASAFQPFFTDDTGTQFDRIGARFGSGSLTFILTQEVAFGISHGADNDNPRTTTQSVAAGITRRFQ